MKRLNSTECLDLFKSLDGDTKRRALEAVGAIHQNPQIFRDVLSIVNKYLDLQTWARLRQCCKLFRQHLTIEPPREMLDTLFSGEVKRKHKPVLAQLFYYYAKRFLFYMYKKQVDYVAEWDANKPAPEIIIRDDGIVLTIPPRRPDLFSLVNVWSALVSCLNSQDSRKWFTVPMWGKCTYKISFPYGYICGPEATNPHGNIFLNDWQQLVYIAGSGGYEKCDLKPHHKMTKEERQHFAFQKEQLKKLKE